MIAPWANDEVATVDLGDERLDARLATVLSALGNRPNRSLPAACGGRAEMKAAYRSRRVEAEYQKVGDGRSKRVTPHARYPIEALGAKTAHFHSIFLRTRT